MKNKRIVIIGAGPAGLTAGLELIRKGFKVKILEKDSQYVGGISRTVKYKDYRFDIGGHRFFTKNKRVNTWWRDIMKEDFLVRPRVSRWYYRKKFFSYPINIFEILFKFGPIFAFRIFASYIFRKVFPIKPEDNLDAWFRNNFGDYLAKPFFIDYNLKLWGIPCRELSMDFAEQRIKGVSITKTLIESLKKVFGIKTGVKSFIEEFNYPAHGPGELWERVRDEFVSKGGKMYMGWEVIGLNNSDGRIESVTAKSSIGTKKFDGDIFLSTMPYKDLVLKLKSIIPKKVVNAAQSLKFRDFVTVALVVNKEYISEDTWVYTHDKGMKPIRFQNFKNWSPAMVPRKEVTVIGLEYVCTQGDEIWKLSKQQMKEQGIKDFESLGFAKRSDIIDSEVVRLKEVYPVYDREYKKNVNELRRYLDRFENLYALGRGGIHRYNNTDHSMMTAFLTVENVLLSKKKYDVFFVNSDAQYHEESIKEK